MQGSEKKRKKEQTESKMMMAAIMDSPGIDKTTGIKEVGTEARTCSRGGRGTR